MRAFFVQKCFCQSQNVTREKLRKAFSYEKILMKLTPDDLNVIVAFLGSSCAEKLHVKHWSNLPQISGQAKNFFLYFYVVNLIAIRHFVDKISQMTIVLSLKQTPVIPC